VAIFETFHENSVQPVSGLIAIGLTSSTTRQKQNMSTYEHIGTVTTCCNNYLIFCCFGCAKVLPLHTVLIW